MCFFLSMHFFCQIFPGVSMSFFSECAIFIRQIFPGMAADVTGKLHVGDAILSVDAQVAQPF